MTVRELIEKLQKVENQDSILLSPDYRDEGAGYLMVWDLYELSDFVVMLSDVALGLEEEV